MVLTALRYSFFRAKEWALAIHREDLSKLTTFANLYVCSEHFTDEMYNCPSLRNSGSQLTWNALPRSDKASGITAENSSLSQHSPNTIQLDHSYCRCEDSTESALTCNELSCATHYKKPDGNVRALRRRVKLLQCQLRKLNLQRRREKRASLSTRREFASPNFPADLKDFIQNQVNNFRIAPGGRRYTSCFYKNCLLLYHHSRRCYMALRKIFYMPSLRCLRRKVQTFFDKVSIPSFYHYLCYTSVIPIPGEPAT